jgi:hypothetical protein
MTPRALSTAVALLVAAAVVMVAAVHVLSPPTCQVIDVFRPGRPIAVSLVPDGFDSQHVGHTDDGRQFFLTTPFEPGRSDFVALYLFDACGRLLEARIDDLGPREATGFDDAEASGSLWQKYGALWKQYDALRREYRAFSDRYNARLAELGDVTFDRITVRPFAIERFGATFGLIADEKDGYWTVDAEPGNYMSFYAPWSAGLYDT